MKQKQKQNKTKKKTNKIQTKIKATRQINNCKKTKQTRLKVTHIVIPIQLQKNTKIQSELHTHYKQYQKP